MLKAVIFDMDGVLIDSEPLHFETDVNVLKEFNVDFKWDEYKDYIGSTKVKIWENIKEKHKLSPSLEELIRLSDIEKARIINESGYREIKGVVRLVNNIYDQGYKLAIASQSPYDYIVQAMTAIKLKPLFSSIVSGLQLENPKPAPDIYYKTAQNLGVKAGECIVIEDTARGVESAKLAGMICVGFVNPNSGDQDLSRADCLVHSFKDINYEFFEKLYKDIY